MVKGQIPEPRHGQIPKSNTKKGIWGIKKGGK
jgi:hypothetical protein